jgi:hypothetical protein
MNDDQDYTKIGTAEPEFMGDPDDERLAGEIYNNLPSFPYMNQVNRKKAVHVIAEAIRQERANVRKYGGHNFLSDGKECPRTIWPKSQVYKDGPNAGQPVAPECLCGFEKASE